MCRWGRALALGPNINAPMDADAERAALAALREAQALAAGAKPVERALIEALATRYGEPAGADRTRRDSAYARAMAAVVRRFPRDDDAATLYAESMLDLRPWDQWGRDGAPKPGTREAVAALERVLARNPNHPGACHYYIHAVEASRTPGRALPCAERLPRLMPGAGHLVHMPAHTYMRVGRYADAVRANQHAVHADERYIADRKPQGYYPMVYYPHNYHFLWAAASMAGMRDEGIGAARGAAQRLTPEIAKAAPPLEYWIAMPVYALSRFGRWEEILREPAPDADLRFATASWHFARGLAFNATGKRAEAQQALDSVRAIAAAIPEDRIVGTNNSARVVLGIAEGVLSGEIAARAGDTDAAVRALEEAARLEDGLNYDEPSPWPYPARHILGAVLLDAGRAKSAEEVYRTDLERNPENGWSLFGLTRALRMQNRSDEASAAEARFHKAWSSADVELEATRY
jgi:tetratricopeptide (TPR) repeat protein